MVAMNWLHVTRKIAESFGLQGCFLLARETDEWVGDKPPSSFRDFLGKQMRERASTYFDEVRFFKLTEAKGESQAAFLALLPITLKHVPYEFLGLMYETPDQLQELLRFRVLPMYLIFYLHQMVAEARVRNADSTQQKALLRALEEKRLYAAQLEKKLQHMAGEIDRVRNAEMTRDQRLTRLNALLDRQTEEQRELATAYQELFSRYQDAEKDYLQSSVGLETRIYELERERRALNRVLGERHGEGLVPRERLEIVEEKLARASEGLRESDEREKAMRAKLEPLQQKVAYYRERAIKLDEKLKGVRVEQALRESGG